MARKIHWHGLSARDARQCGDNCDLYTKRPHGTWDVVHGVDGWVVYAPSAAVSRDRARIVVGDVTRETARLRAEELIQIDEGV